jgi:hypothetical protein
MKTVATTTALVALFVLPSVCPAQRPDAKAAEDSGGNEAVEAVRWRTWTDSSGKHKTEARFEAVSNGKVKLVKRDGSTIQLPLEKLCDEDQKWIKQKNVQQQSRDGIQSFAPPGVPQGRGQGNGDAKPTEVGFRLVAPCDLVYIPKTFNPKANDPKANKPKPNKPKPNERQNRFVDPRQIRGTLPMLEDTAFRILKDGKTPDHGFFNVDGKPVAPVWKSSDPSILRITDPNSPSSTLKGVPRNPMFVHVPAELRFDILGLGKVTVTVSVGTWSDHADLNIVEGPVSGGEKIHDVLEKYGYPAKKYKYFWNMGLPTNGDIPNGFEKAPEPCYGFFPTGEGPRGAGWGRGEYWEYPQWPRCLVIISGVLNVEEVHGICTRRPGQSKKANQAN